MKTQDMAAYRRQRRAQGLDRPIKIDGRVTTERAAGVVVVPDPEDFAHPESCVRSPA